MRTFTTNLLAQMNEALEQVTLPADNTLQKAEKSYHITQGSLEKLKAFILDHNFVDKQEEIVFFKEIKPQFLKELIYWRKIFYLEANKPVGDKEMLEAYYKQVIERINTFFEDNSSFYIYYRMGKTDRDEYYFVRAANGQELLPEYSLDIDPKFSSVHSFKLAKVQAYERLNKYLLSELNNLHHPPSPVDSIESKKKHKLKWTDSKAALIELVYALHAKGSIDNGNADIKDIIAAFEYLFDIDLGNYYAVFQQNIRIRKKSRTTYIDLIKDYLERRMDELDDHPR